ncbi:thyrotropin receptor-like [Amphiura filiformis]|uniref:thyrotropin receptor-like n=1 Tax=Amphiura filiformis TaxID=82378 RepID=UPI003B20B5CC
MAGFQLLMKIFLTFFASISLVVGSSSGSDCSDSDLMTRCPSACCCHNDTNIASQLKAFCSGKNLTKIPDNFPNGTTKIILDGNLIKDIPPGSMSHLESLKVLSLGDNRIQWLHLEALSTPRLNKLSLSKNSLSQLTPGTFTDLTALEYLDVSNNAITGLDWIGTFHHLTQLKILSMARNRVEMIPSYSIRNMTSLQVLSIEDNRINKIESNAFSNPSLSRLFIGRNFLTHLSPSYFTGLPKLEQLGLNSNPIETIDWRTFTYLPMLRVLEVCCVRNLTKFPDLTGTRNLQQIILDRCSISSVNSSLCSNSKHRMESLQRLDLHSNSIEVLPRLSKCSQLKIINFANNKIISLEGKLFQGLSFALDLSLKSNKIGRIPASAFLGLTTLNYLDLNNNGISFIHPDAFKPLENLQELYLASNRLTHLPSLGLQNLWILDTSVNEHLEQIPPHSELKSIIKIVTEHPYHCCDYVHISRQRKDSNYHWGILSADTSDSNYSNSTIIPLMSGNATRHYSSSSASSSSMSSTISDFLSSDYSSFSYTYSSALESGAFQGKEASCYPQPGPFMPCADLFGSWFLRVGVWLVFLLALIGNGIVILVIAFSRTKLDVSRFLICNLACADFAMGIYLGFLAVVDAATLGVFRQYGVHWQLSAGCGAAGFLAVFSSELSIYTLSVITLERFYAIKHALHLEKRLKLQQAVFYMCFGWVFALTVALLPLFGINSYYKYAVCLPFDIATKGALAYASGIMLLNGVAFVVIVMCYISIYCAIQGSLAWNCNDSRVALRCHCWYSQILSAGPLLHVLVLLQHSKSNMYHSTLLRF